jgi:hypothetical protein
VNSILDDTRFGAYQFLATPISRTFAKCISVASSNKERLKKYFNAIKAAEPQNTIQVGKFIKLFEDVFDQELKARNKSHHHSRFEDIAIDNVMLTEVILTRDDKNGFVKNALYQQHLAAYRNAANKWAKRVRARGAKMDEVLEETARATLIVCGFLTA